MRLLAAVVIKGGKEGAAGNAIYSYMDSFWNLLMAEEILIISLVSFNFFRLIHIVVVSTSSGAGFAQLLDMFFVCL